MSNKKIKTTQEKAFQVISYHDAYNCTGPSWCIAYVKAKDGNQAKHVVLDNISAIAPGMTLTPSSLRASRCKALDESQEFVDGFLSSLNEHHVAILKKAKLVLEVSDRLPRFLTSPNPRKKTLENIKILPSTPYPTRLVL